MWETTLLHVAGFLLGSIPVGYLVGRLRGVDVRRHGSGNVGATNVGRTLGKSAGIVTLFCDVLKGCLSAGLPYYFSVDAPELFAPTVGLFAILGHCFSPFLKFRGGKGVATSLGVFIMLSPLSALIAVLAFTLTLAVSGFVSLGSILAAVSVPTTIAITEKGPAHNEMFLVALACALLIVIKHRGNISRLRQGSESRYTFSKPSGTK